VSLSSDWIEHDHRAPHRRAINFRLKAGTERDVPVFMDGTAENQMDRCSTAGLLAKKDARCCDDNVPPERFCSRSHSRINAVRNSHSVRADIKGEA
jgi:hypothetical protein